MKLSRHNTYQNPILFLDGHGNSGKALLMKVLPYFNGVEQSTENNDFYLLLNLFSLGKISDDAAEVFLKSMMDREIYNRMVCRDINFRIWEVSCFLKYPYPLDYIKRMFAGEGKTINKLIWDKSPIYLNATQNALIQGRFLFNVLENRLKIICINKHPIDIIYDLWQKGFVKRIGTDPSNQRLTYEVDDTPISIIARYNDTDYQILNDLEKTVHWIYYETNAVNEEYSKLKEDDKKKIIFIKYEDFVTNPYAHCKTIESFIGRKPIRRLKRKLKKCGCPGKIPDNTWKYSKIVVNINETYKKLLDELIGDYDKPL